MSLIRCYYKSSKTVLLNVLQSIIESFTDVMNFFPRLPATIYVRVTDREILTWLQNITGN